MYRIAKFANTLREADHMDAVGRTIIDSFTELGFEQICLSTNKASAAELAENPDVKNFTDDCLRDYICGGMSNIDFNIRKGLTVRKPFWFTVKPDSKNKDDDRFADFLHSYGISAGFFLISLPLNGFFSGGGCMLSADKRMVHNKQNLTLATALANISFMKLDMFVSNTPWPTERAPYLDKLNQLQLDLLQWASEGKSNADLAVILGVKRTTVDYHFRVIFKKMGVFTKMQAIALFSRDASFL